MGEFNKFVPCRFGNGDTIILSLVAITVSSFCTDPGVFQNVFWGSCFIIVSHVLVSNALMHSCSVFTSRFLDKYLAKVHFEMCSN